MTRFSRSVLSLTALVLTPSLAAAQPRPASVVAFVGANVVPMDREYVIMDQTVIVRGDRIAEVGARDKVAIPAGATVVQARGKYLMPGLAEMHAHVPPGSATEAGLRELMFLYVANGVTTIRGMLGAPYQLQLRERLASGEILGPTLYVGAPSLNGTSAPTPDSAMALVRAYKAAGYDLLKIHPGLSRAGYDSMARVARELGITWGGHVPADVGAFHAFEMRQSTIDHLDGLLEATVPRERIAAGQSFADQVWAMAPAVFPDVARMAGEAGVWHIPTVYLWENLYGAAVPPERMAELPEMRYVSAQTVRSWVETKRRRLEQQQRDGLDARTAARFLELRREMLRALVRSDAKILMGTDSPQLFMVPGFALHRELEVMARAGMTPFQIYRTGTTNVARYARDVLKVDGGFGTVTVGGRADLVLLDADPMTSVANLQRRAGVMVRGRWVSAEAIRDGLAEIERRYAR